MSTEQIIEALQGVLEPELNRSIADLGMVRETELDKKGRARFLIALPGEDYPHKLALDRNIHEALESADGVSGVKVEFTVMSEAERAAMTEKLGGGSRENPFSDPACKTRCLLIASGKGGVGKSSVSTNLAVTLAGKGHSVALLDADVWGFSIPRMLGVDRPPVVIDQLLVPPKAHGVKCISMGFFAEEDQAVIWRGPMLHKALEQFLTDVFWDEPDFLIVDLPPGTGDISISLSQFLPHSEVYIVTTPQLVAQKVAQRAGIMAKKVNLEVKGVIENMSWFRGDDGKSYELFGAGGGMELSELLGVPLLGQVPFSPDMRQGCDEGLPIAASDPSGETANAFSRIAETMVVDLAPTRRYNRELRITTG